MNGFLSKLKKRPSLIVLAFLSLLEIALIYFFISKPQLVAWDESVYILDGYRLRLDLQTGRFGHFWDYSMQMVKKPFLHNWYLAVSTFPFNYSVNAARLANLILFLPTVLVFWQLARLVSQKRAFLITAVGLLVTSPIMIFLYSIAMREGLALLFTLLSFWLFLLGRKKEGVLYFFLAFLASLGVFFIKYHYFVYVLAALGLESFFWFFSQKNYLKIRIWKRLAAYFVPLGTMTAFWVFIPADHFRIIKEAFTQAPGLFLPSFPVHVLFYLFEMAFSYTFSWLAFGIIGIGFIWALVKNRKNYLVRTLAGVFLINFLLVLKMVHKNQARYLFTTVPFFFIVGSLGAVELLTKFRKLLKKPLYKGLLLPLIAAGGLIIIKDLVYLPRTIKPTASHLFGLAVFYEPDYQIFGPEDISWLNFNRQEWPHQPPPQNHEKVEEVMTFILENVDLSKKIMPLNFCNELSPYLFHFNLEQARQKGQSSKQTDFSEYFVVFQITPFGRFDTFDYRRFSYQYAIQAEQALSYSFLTKINQKNFPYLGVTAIILGKK